MPSQVLKNSLQESQARCQELGAQKNEAQAKLDQLNAEKTSMEQLLLEARRSVEETKIAVSKCLRPAFGEQNILVRLKLASKLPLELTVRLSGSAATGGDAERGAAREKGSFESETSGLSQSS